MVVKRKKTKPLRFGLYGESEILTPEFVHCERMVFQNPKHNSYIPPHVHSNLFQIFFIYAGSVRFSFDQQHHLVHASAVVTIPENTLHGMKCADDIDGMVLTFSSSFAENVMSANVKSSHQLNGASILEINNPRTLGRLKDIVNGLDEELYEDASKKDVIHSYLDLLLHKIQQLSLEAHEEFISNDTHTNRLFKEFLRSVKKSYTPMKPVTLYASELGISTMHLNRICVASINKSPLQIIHDFIMAEAKKYLMHSDYSIAEISYRLNFVDPAYFSRFFKKFASVSPKEFRYTR